MLALLRRVAAKRWAELCAPAFVERAATKLLLVRTASTLLGAQLRTDLAQGRREVSLAVAKGFEPSKALALHAFEIC